MIKKFLFLTFLISGLLAVSLLFSACDHDRTHKHNFVWESDRLYHWGICECGEIEKTMHSYSSDTCNICEADIIASEGLAFELDSYYDEDNDIEYTGYAVAIGTCTDSEIVVPATYDDKPVIAIQRYGFGSFDQFAEYDYITKVLLPDGIKKIMASAFACSCPNLEEIHFPEGLKVIGYSAFEYCFSLKEINLPEGIQEIYDLTFHYCSSLKEVNLPEGIKTIGLFAFADCLNLEKIYLQDGLEKIDASAFADCLNLKEIHLPCGPKTIYAYTFEGCENLTSISIPNSVTAITPSAFLRCSSLESIVLPASLKEIYRYAFEKCPLQTVYYNGTVRQWQQIKIKNRNWDKDIYNEDPLLLATIYYYSEKKPTEEGNYWHYVNGKPEIWKPIPHVHNFILASDSLYHWMSCECGEIKEREEHKYDGDVCTVCGYDRSHVHNFVWESDRLYHWGICECGEIEKTMHSYSYDTCKICGAEIIASKGLAFEQYNYKYFDENTKIEYIGFYAVAIGNCKDSEIVIPAMYNDTPVIAIQQYGFSPLYNSKNPYSKNITNVLLPERIKEIGKCAFTGSGNLQDINLPYTLKEIGESAFSECESLQKIIMPDSVTKIGAGAFSYCYSLTYVKLSPNIITFLGGDVFHGSVFEGCHLLKFIELPDNLEWIGSLTFERSGLESIVLPASLKEIYRKAFNKSHLQSVYYKGTFEQWEQIVIDQLFNEPLLSATVYYYSEERPTEKGNYWHYIDGAPTIWE